MLRVTNLSLSVGSTQLLEGANAQLVEGHRVALVGSNGCGKSTLMRALARESAGESAETYFTIGAGRIDATIDAEGVLFIEQDNLPWKRLLPDVDLDEDEVQAMTVADALDYAAAVGGEEAIEDAEAWRRLTVLANEPLEWRVAGYGTTPIAELSPGCAVRAYLAIAMQRTTVKVLLLDEPTNHLDLPSILWLQRSIVESGKTLLVVSHDEAFLDAVCDHVWDIDSDKLEITVSGSKYSAFRHAQHVAREQQKAAYVAQQERHSRLTHVANRLRDASAAGQKHDAKDHDLLQRDFRRDRAGRSGRKAKAVEALRDAGPTVERVVEHAPLRIKLKPMRAGSDASIILDSVVLGHAGTPLGMPAISHRIDFGERVAILGFNGVGKSTLLRTLTGSLPAVDGHAAIGRDLLLGNLMQEHESLPRDVTPRQHFSALTGMSLHKMCQPLINYGLTLRQIDCPIGELNPGARARALLAGFALRSVNTLILDEPTNHLDMEAIHEVTSTINCFEGTVIVVSHSLAFLQSLDITRVLQLSRDGLAELPSVDAFIDTTERQAAAVVDGVARRKAHSG